MLDQSIACGAAADTLGRPVLGRLIAGIRPCTGIDETDDDGRGAFENAQKTVGGAVREKEQCVKGNKKGKSKRRTSLANLPPNHQLNHLLQYQSQAPKKWRKQQHLYFMRTALPPMPPIRPALRARERGARGFAKRNPLQRCEAASRKRWSARLPDHRACRSTGPPAAPSLALATKFGAFIGRSGHL